mmetsp:Transcript_3310/g.9618  ORF Transcript_3310/g.9618 Transcript_3310/m.9618 type:complete len:200 (+) Transcript_3310:920-1519(+)
MVKAAESRAPEGPIPGAGVAEPAAVESTWVGAALREVPHCGSQVPPVSESTKEASERSPMTAAICGEKASVWQKPGESSEQSADQVRGRRWCMSRTTSTCVLATGRTRSSSRYAPTGAAVLPTHGAAPQCSQTTTARALLAPDGPCCDRADMLSPSSLPSRPPSRPSQQALPAGPPSRPSQQTPVRLPDDPSRPPTRPS